MNATGHIRERCGQFKFKPLKVSILILIVFAILCSCQNKNEDLSISFKQSECEPDSDISALKTKILKRVYKHDTLYLSISTVANCAGIYSVAAGMANDTLNIKYSEGYIEKVKTSTGDIKSVISEESCDCCFEFYFSIFGLKSIPQSIRINDNILK